MAVEIERKFLITDEVSLRDVPSVPVRQGYLVRGDESEVRIRQEGAAYSLTVKQGKGLERSEFEISIDAGQFETLWPATEGARVAKARRLVPLESARVACVDTFEGALAGLVTVEVEFGTVEEAHSFEPPGWFGTEVTEDGRFANGVLSTQGAPW
ncbi:CYTH domain-containing protein [Streptomyces seoulensis]